jgi:DNA-binding NarL/FixJ family response regulator
MIRVTLFEDYPDMRDILSTLIENSRDFYLAGAYSNANDVLNIVKKQKPHVVLMDIQMPGISGIEATRLIKSKYPQVQVLEAIAETYNGGAPMSPSIARKVLNMFTNQQTTFSPTEEYQTLSEREKEILGHLTKGMSYKMIADACQISYGTVNSHLKNIYEKLHVHSATEAVQKALLQRIV